MIAKTHFLKFILTLVFASILALIFICAVANASDKEGTYLTRRLDRIKNPDVNSIMIVPYKPSYITYSYDFSPNDENAEMDGIAIKDHEIKLQVSFIVPITPLYKSEDSALLFNFAYTQQTHFQVLNSESSRPVRETEFQPEFHLSLIKDLKIPFIPFTHRELVAGWWHHSNGRSNGVPNPPPGNPDASLSRGWNRYFVRSSAESDSGYFSFILQGWIAEPAKENEDIEEYLGNGDLNIIYHDDNNEVSLLLRNNLHFDSINRGAFQIDYRTPIPQSRKWKLYMQYYYGYGETLIDYNHSTNRVCLGVSISDWL